MKNNRGYSLIEVILAMALLAIAIFPLLSNFGPGLIQDAFLNDQAVAVQIARYEIDSMRNKYDDDGPGTDFMAAYPRFHKSTVRTPITANLDEIKVTITWNAGKGNGICTIESLVAKDLN